MILLLLACDGGESKPGDSVRDTGVVLDTDTGGGDTSDSGDSGFGGDTGPFDPGDRSIEATVEPVAKVVGVERHASIDGRLWLGGAADVDADGRADVLALWGTEGVVADGAGYTFPGDVRGRWRVDEIAGSRFASGTSDAGWDLAATRDGTVAVGVINYYNGDAWAGRVVVLTPPVTGDYELDSAGIPIDATCDYYHTTECLLGKYVSFGENTGDGIEDLLVGNVYGVDLAGALLQGPFGAPVDAGSEATAAFDMSVDQVEFADDLDGDGVDDVLAVNVDGTKDYRTVVYYGRLAGMYGAGDADARLPAPWSAPVSVGDLTGDGYPDVVARYTVPSPGGMLVAVGPLLGDVDTSAMPQVQVGDDRLGFGLSVVGLGDLDEDGFADLLVGGPEIGSGPSTAGPGAAYLYFGPIADGTGPEDADEVLSGDEDDGFGYELSNLGDVDGDGIVDLAVAGPGDDDGGEDAGAVWLYSGADLIVRR